MNRWIRGKRLKWKKYPEFRPLFQEFVLGLKMRVTYSLEEIEERGEKWKQVMSILGGHLYLIELHSAGAFYDFTKLETKE